MMKCIQEAKYTTICDGCGKEGIEPSPMDRIMIQRTFGPPIWLDACDIGCMKQAIWNKAEIWNRKN